MENNDQIKNESVSNTIPFDISQFPDLQYMKVIFADANNELRELNFEVNTIDSNIIKLSSDGNEHVNLTCPTGVVIKIAAHNAIYFAKAILKIIRNINNKLIFVLKTPTKTIRQQNRRFYRVNAKLPCVLLINNHRSKQQTYLAQSVNISKGGVLLCNTESLFDDSKRDLQFSAGDRCYIAVFLKQNLKVKASAKFIRTEYVDDSYRYAFQFLYMQQTCLDALDKYITKEKLNLLNMIESD